MPRRPPCRSAHRRPPTRHAAQPIGDRFLLGPSDPPEVGPQRAEVLPKSCSVPQSRGTSPLRASPRPRIPDKDQFWVPTLDRPQTPDDLGRDAVLKVMLAPSVQTSVAVPPRALPVAAARLGAGRPRRGAGRPRRGSTTRPTQTRSVTSLVGTEKRTVPWRMVDSSAATSVTPTLLRARLIRQRAMIGHRPSAIGAARPARPAPPGHLWG